MKRWIWTLILAVLAAPAAAEKAPTAKAAAWASNAFAADLYAAVRREPGNLFLSPYSVSTALAMTCQGARGETRRQMDEVLRLGGVTPETHRLLAEAFEPETVLEGHRNPKKVPTHALSVANRLWGQKGYVFEAPFLGLLRKEFGAPFGEIDFGKTEAARKAINAWVAKATREKIMDIVPEGLPTPDARLVLANAIYFRASWRDPFEARWTKNAAFTGPGGRVEVPMMHRVGEYSYSETPKSQVLEIPYRHGATSMIVVLPKPGVKLLEIERGLTPKAVAALTSEMRPAKRRVSVKLPKFEITWSRDLKRDLPGMGMRNAFEAGRADFSGMTKTERLYIGNVLHKAFVAVDEAGTEAAAATVVMMLKGAAPGKPVEFHADRPFLFLIRHAKTGCVLFMGRVVNPKA